MTDDFKQQQDLFEKSAEKEVSKRMEEKEFEVHVEKEVIVCLDAIVEDDVWVVHHYVMFVSQLQ